MVEALVTVVIVVFLGIELKTAGYRNAWVIRVSYAIIVANPTILASTVMLPEEETMVKLI